ncbi:MAG: hypothetical protein P8168_13000 [Deltaproteobacteria bacterium]
MAKAKPEELTFEAGLKRLEEVLEALERRFFTRPFPEDENSGA